MEWASRVIGDFERDAPPKSSSKKKRDSQPSAEALGEAMDRACLHTWLTKEHPQNAKVVKSLSGAKLQKFKQMWSKGLPVREKLTPHVLAPPHSVLPDRTAARRKCAWCVRGFDR